MTPRLGGFGSGRSLLRGLPALAWLEVKIFLREPLGVVGTVVVPVLLFMAVGRMLGPRFEGRSARVQSLLAVDAPVLVAIFVALNAVLSLVTIVAVYREGGILKRLRATPLRPETILAAHVVVKLLLTAVTFALMVLAGGRAFPLARDVPIVAFGIALLISTASLISVGFLIASVVPTARFAQPIGSLILYPMLALSGLFVPVESLPPVLRTVASVLPLTPAVSLLRGVWQGDAWWAHTGDIGALLVASVVFTALAARFFRWE